MTIVVLMADLFFSATITAIAKQLGIKVQLLKDKEVLLDKIRTKPLAVIFDLNYSAADPVRIIEQLKADPGTKDIPLIGFVSHVQTELKSKAQQAGCDEVLARSVFAQKLPAILARHMTPQAG